MPKTSTAKPKGAKGAKKRAGKMLLVPDTVKNQHFARWLEKAKLAGLEQRHIVWELVVRQNKSFTETAILLEVSAQWVGELYREMRDAAIEGAPKTQEDYIRMRFELSERIHGVLADAAETPWDPRCQMVRLKALDQLAALYGLNLKPGDGGRTGDSPVEMPDEIAEKVKALTLDVHGRKDDIELAQAALRDVTPAEEAKE